MNEKKWDNRSLDRYENDMLGPVDRRKGDTVSRTVIMVVIAAVFGFLVGVVLTIGVLSVLPH